MPEVPALPGSLSELVALVFADEGALSSSMHGFEPRDGQRRMAAALAETITSNGTLLVEAGTGTGKTLAYLIPALLSGRRVLISTGTKTLQEQILSKDIPAVEAAIGRPVRATVMKGRSNYLCLHRLENAKAGTFKTLADVSAYRIIDAWAEETETGDRAEIRDLPDDTPVWSELTATTEQCLGSECPKFGDCFVMKMRQRAAESELVIVNHHLLCADGAVRQSGFAEVIPETDVIVIDEAHQLEDVATQYFGFGISHDRFDTMARDAERAAAVPGADADRTADIKRDGERLRDASRAFFAALHASAFRLGAPGSSERVRFTEEHAAAIAGEVAALKAALESLEGTIALAKDASEELLAVARRADHARGDTALLTHADDPAFVFFVEMRGRHASLRAAPIDVSTIVRTLLLERAQATVLTSATLAVEGKFSYVRGRLGIQEAEELRLPSEFDYRDQAIIYLPRRMPDPRSPEYGDAAAREMFALMRRTEGRGFLLFTSYAAMRHAYGLISPHAEWPLLMQGDAPRSVLLDSFRRTPHAVLFATASFWQGVDVPGDALSCVVIDKLPFASPGDPITAARLDAITAAGGSPFDDYQVPLATLTLLQGMGRLIRSRQDRGVLAILDPRLRTKGYGRRFLASFPPAPITHDLALVERFLAA
ncbi:MAG TPA: ATP-dependent DNA helicase [Vicinamibacterales bacterium]|nr:ATP-dependent DNA helicase [Vicinamibacterales bacterium]